MNSKSYVSSECLLNNISNLFAQNTPLPSDEECICFTTPSIFSPRVEAAADITITALPLLIFDLSKDIARSGVTICYAFSAVYYKKAQMNLLVVKTSKAIYSR